MEQTIALIAASTILSMPVAAQGGQKYVVANSFAASGCDGAVTVVTSINTGQCFYAKEDCLTNPDLYPECEFLKSQPFGDDISFIATCEGDQIVAKAFNGKGCNDASKAVANGQTLPIPVDRCLLNFKLFCSNDPKEILTSSASSISMSKKYVVANSFASSGCRGAVTQISSINTGQCFYAKEDCLTNPDLAPECELLKSQPFGDDISFIATCEGDQIVAKAFNGKGCNDASKAVANGQTLPIPVDQCLLNFRLFCSDKSYYLTTVLEPRTTVLESNKPVKGDTGSSSSSIRGILALLGLFFV